MAETNQFFPFSCVYVIYVMFYPNNCRYRSHGNYFSCLIFPRSYMAAAASSGGQGRVICWFLLISWFLPRTPHLWLRKSSSLNQTGLGHCQPGPQLACCPKTQHCKSHCPWLECGDTSDSFCISWSWGGCSTCPFWKSWGQSCLPVWCSLASYRHYHLRFWPATPRFPSVVLYT